MFKLRKRKTELYAQYDWQSERSAEAGASVKRTQDQ